jgi:hypothetical protein
LVLGSLVNKNGEQFGESSDIDLVIVIPELANASARARWLESFSEDKQQLEGTLVKALRRSAQEPIVSVVAADRSLRSVRFTSVTSFHHQPEAQHPKSPAIETRLAAIIATDVAHNLRDKSGPPPPRIWAIGHSRISIPFMPVRKASGVCRFTDGWSGYGRQSLAERDGPARSQESDCL